MISVIVPAYNEEAVIERCLRHLTDGAPEGALQIIVACNGCHDRTAEIARAFDGPVTVVETATASKVAALNLGDPEATGYPRFYVDADVIMPWASIKALADEMQRTGKPAGGPRLKMGLEHASLGVKAFYAVWMKMSFHQAGMVGCGVYALSEEGRARFGAFPDLIADDGYVRSLFVDEERGDFSLRTARRVHLAGLHKANCEARDIGMADEVLCSVEHPIGAMFLCRRFHTAQIRPGPGFCHGQAMAFLLSMQRWI